MIQKPVDELTEEELKREITEKLGYHTEIRRLSPTSLEWRVLIEPNGEIYRYEDGHAPRQMPDDPDGDHYLMLNHPHDWPNDLEAALDLCLDILDRLNKHANDRWQLTFNAGYVSFELLAYGGGIHTSFGATGRNALSLSRLALTILREQKDLIQNE